MRPAYLLALLLALAACDGAGDADADAVVGTWRLDALTETVEVTSRTAQALPDLSATPTVSVTATGAYSADFGVVVDLTGAYGTVQLVLATDEGYLSGTGADLLVAQIPGSAQATLYDFATAEQFSGFFGDATILSQRGGRFVLPRLPLRGDGEVTVGGTVDYPEIALAPDQPTEIQPYDEDIEGVLTVTFEAGGAFSAQASGPGGSASATGTWERLDAERVRLTTAGVGVIESGVFEVSLASGALVLRGEDLDRDIPCGSECIREVESGVFAEPGSLSAVSFVSTFRFQAGR